jgi:serine/threonine-protein kinase
MELHAGATLGRYELLVPIAAGGMARVWAARLRGRAGFSKIVALKMILPEHAGDEEFQQMFLDEARIASKLRHGNACETLDLGEEEGVLFLTMEWVDGTSLWRLLRASGKTVPLPARIAAKIVGDACAGLHAAHELVDDDGTRLDVVHRDVSPQNLLVSADGEVKVSDFGVAKALGKSHATAKGHVKGKIAYMAPEQLGAGAIDRRCDVFALGVVLYEATTGKKPFDAETDAAILQAILGGKYRKPREVDPSYPEALERIVVRALEKERSSRYASAAQMRVDLEDYLAESGAPVRSENVADLVRARCGKEIATRRDEIRAACKTPPAVVELSQEDLVSEPRGTGPTKLDRSRDDEASKKSRGAIVLFAAVLLIASIALALWSNNREQRMTDAPDATPILAPSVPPAITSASAPPAFADAADPDVITFDIEPRQAAIIVDGQPLPADARALPRPSGARTRVVLVKAPGYRDELLMIAENTPSPRVVKLVPRADARP